MRKKSKQLRDKEEHSRGSESKGKEQLSEKKK